MKKMTIRIPNSLYNDITVQAKKENIPVHTLNYNILEWAFYYRNFLRNSLVEMKVTIPERLKIAIEVEAKNCQISTSELVIQRLNFLLPENIEKTRKMMEKRIKAKKAA